MDIVEFREFLGEVVADLVIVLGDDDGGTRLEHLLRLHLHRNLLLLGFLDDVGQLVDGVGLLLLDQHLFRTQVGVAQRDGDGKLTALFEVARLDAAVMQFDE